jgi:long-chain acyl-CoA synthetase
MASEIPDTLALLPFFVGGRFPYPHLIGVCREGGISYTSGQDLVGRVREIGLGLGALGGPAGNEAESTETLRGVRVAIISESRPEWLFVDLAILAAGAVTVPIYPTLSAEQVETLLADSEAAIVVVSTDAQVAKVARCAGRLPHLKAVVTIAASTAAANVGVPVISLAGVAELGGTRIRNGWGVARAFHDTARTVAAGDLATIIYTSGSSGEPKGVMLTHGNIVANLRDVQQVLSLSDEDVALSFLPLCHAFERTVAYVYLTHGVSVVFAESIETLGRDLRQVRPNIMTGVPRVFEKLLDRIFEGGRAVTGLKRRIFDRAITVARAKGAIMPEGGRPSLWLRAQLAIAEKLVYATIRERLGGRLRFAVSGSAPLREDVGRLFFGIGLEIAEGYGLTETSPVLTVNRPGALRFGTVGPPLPSVSIRIADDGEILAKGPNIMAGYFKRPDLTAEVIVDGWFHTGDVGALDAAGCLRITDRKKELLVTSGGKKVAPQPIEAALRGQPIIGEAIVVGDGQRFPAVLILPRWAALAAAIGVAPPADGQSRRAIGARDDVRAAFERAIDAVNAPLAQFEKLKTFALVYEDFSIETGELTPTLKVKRRVVETRYRDAILALYQ